MAVTNLKFPGFVFLCLLIPLSPASADQDADFLAARDAYTAGNFNRLDVYAKRLKGYLLEPYVAYWQLQAHIDEAGTETVRQFLVQQSSSPLADRLRGEWLKSLGRRHEWSLFQSEYPNLLKDEPAITCYALQAKLQQNDPLALPQAKSLWFTGSDMPTNCTPVFEALADNGRLSIEDVWTRLRLALDAGNVSVAANIANYLPSPQSKRMRSLESIAENPQRFLTRGKFDLEQRSDRELTTFALTRLARQQPAEAGAFWEKLFPSYPEQERGYVWGQLALQAARKHDSVALKWFTHVENSRLNDNQLAWKTRSALRARNWTEVLGAIDAMSENVRQEDNWRYWKARALKANGNIGQANMLFAPLSKQHNFYGLLAEEELGAVLENRSASYKPSEDEVKTAQNIPGLQRALALYQLDLRSEATREWTWAIRSLDDRQLLAAAELARRNNWYDRAINTADKTVQLHNFELRYLAPHRDLMENYTKQWGLDEAWVYGLIRQESRFVTQAKSSVGATGLMQVMPATARWIAKKLGLRDYRHPKINRVETNLEFGTYYLKHVQDHLGGQPVLATAAYNAGPQRAERWRSDVPLEGAVYAESIPFTETRDYVKKVMSNTMYYASRFGQRLISLKQRLGSIPGRSQRPDASPDADAAP